MTRKNFGSARGTVSPTRTVQFCAIVALLATALSACENCASTGACAGPPYYDQVITEANNGAAAVVVSERLALLLDPRRGTPVLSGAAAHIFDLAQSVGGSKAWAVELDSPGEGTATITATATGLKPFRVTIVEASAQITFGLNALRVGQTVAEVDGAPANCAGACLPPRVPDSPMLGVVVTSPALHTGTLTALKPSPPRRAVRAAAVGELALTPASGELGPNYLLVDDDPRLATYYSTSSPAVTDHLADLGERVKLVPPPGRSVVSVAVSPPGALQRQEAPEAGPPVPGVGLVDFQVVSEWPVVATVTDDVGQASRLSFNGGLGFAQRCRASPQVPAAPGALAQFNAIGRGSDANVQRTCAFGRFIPHGSGAGLLDWMSGTMRLQGWHVIRKASRTLSFAGPEGHPSGMIVVADGTRYGQGFSRDDVQGTQVRVEMDPDASGSASASP